MKIRKKRKQKKTSAQANSIWTPPLSLAVRFRHQLLSPPPLMGPYELCCLFFPFFLPFSPFFLPPPHKKAAAHAHAALLKGRGARARFLRTVQLSDLRKEKKNKKKKKNTKIIDVALPL
jgi:hypothetical protein